MATQRTTAGPVNFGYSFDPLALDRDEVRFLVGDTQSDDPLLDDAEINAALLMAERSGRPGGTLSTKTLAVNGTTAVGEISIDLDSSATVKGTIEPGDSFTIAGNVQRYQVTNCTTADNNAFTDVEFLPGLVAEATNDAVVTFRFANLFEAAALCCESLGRRASREVDESIGDKRESLSQKAANYFRAAQLLRRQAGYSGGGLSVPVERV